MRRLFVLTIFLSGCAIGSDQTNSADNTGSTPRDYSYSTDYESNAQCPPPIQSKIILDGKEETITTIPPCNVASAKNGSGKPSDTSGWGENPVDGPVDHTNGTNPTNPVIPIPSNPQPPPR